MIIAIAIYALIFCLAIFLFVFGRIHEQGTHVKSNPVSFIIPFKNEGQRLSPIIDAFNNAEWHEHFEVIFIDDHSDDSSYQKLLSKLDIPYRILRLRKTVGKKNAIAFGVQQATYEHIHTMDADVYFDAKYLFNISCLPANDLTILPVNLTGNSIFQKLNSVEFQWLQTITFSLARLKQPLLCNGANLSFTKSAFLNALKIRG